MIEQNQAEAKRVVDFWRAIELLEPPNAKTQSLQSAKESRIAIEQASTLPWENPQQFGLVEKEGHTWKHTIQLGIINTNELVQSVRKVFPFDSDREDLSPPRASGKTCVASFAVDEKGLPALGSYTLASFVWALGRIVSPTFSISEPGCLAGFDEFQEKQQENFANRRVDCDRPITIVSLQEELEAVFADCGWRPSAVRHIAVIHSQRVKLKKDEKKGEDVEETQQDFLNSFFLSDLKRMGEAVETDDFGEAFRSYLGMNTCPDRVDVRKETAEQRGMLHPERMPAGRWPSNGNHPLSLAQQLAVNLQFAELLEQPGMLAVNGPPGTGKTTLLRDVVAGLLVERAKCIAALSEEDEVFSPVRTLSRGSFRTRIAAPHESLCGFEMVVASSNNGAVENVTKELPANDQIDPAWSSSASYFSKVAERIDSNSWGLIAAVLGNSSNRNSFKNAFWFSNSKGKASTESDTVNLRTLLEQGESRKTLPQAKVDFQDALADFELLQLERGDDADAAAELDLLRKNLQEFEEELKQCREKGMQHKQALKECAHALQEQTLRLEECKLLYEGVLAQRPSFFGFRRFFRTTSVRQWVAQESPAKKAFIESGARRKRSEQERRQRTRALEDLKRRHQTLTARKAAAEKRIAEHSKRLSRLKSLIGENVLDDTFWNKSDAKQQLCSPWTSAEDPMFRARAELFFRALDLHEAFIFHHRKQIISNLRAWIDLISGELGTASNRDVIPALWQTFFLVVPVVSTTFASFARLFKGMNRESLGWLLIDEAGQATPQAAAGAIWRSKKVLVIGDPRQIEPVVTAPEEIIARLATSYSVSDDWSPSCVSAQVLADRMCPWGTYLDRMETAWIACPLRVHRRCAEPMFRIANEIAYDNLMIQGTAECESSIEHCLGPSRWLDCRGSARSGHWIADEGALTLELLSQALLAEQPDFFVISPFRTVAEGMRACFQQQQIELLEQLAERLSSPVRDVLKQRIGTIHTFQGRQADAVILLLGGDVQRPGALAWASRRPNLLNVAITRAKRRLYVVGNRDKWRELQYFSLLADSLPSPEKENLKLANF